MISTPGSYVIQEAGENNFMEVNVSMSMNLSNWGGINWERDYIRCPVLPASVPVEDLLSVIDTLGMSISDIVVSELQKSLGYQRMIWIGLHNHRDVVTFMK
jgi:hypothetical protein